MKIRSSRFPATCGGYRQHSAKLEGLLAAPVENSREFNASD
jgi:hypothetical protein